MFPVYADTIVGLKVDICGAGRHLRTLGGAVDRRSAFALCCKRFSRRFSYNWRQSSTCFNCEHLCRANRVLFKLLIHISSQVTAHIAYISAILHPAVAS
jgi:hypothetical protein